MTAAYIVLTTRREAALEPCAGSAAVEVEG